MQELHLYPKRHRLIIGSIGMVFFLLMSIWMLMRGPNPDSVFRLYRSPLVVYSAAVIGILLFGYLLWFAVRQLLNPRPALSLSGQGVCVQGFSGTFSAPWNEFSAYQWRGKSMLVLLLRDGPAFVARQAAGRPQVTARTLLDRFGSPFLIELKNLEADAAELERRIAQHLPKNTQAA